MNHIRLFTDIKAIPLARIGSLEHNPEQLQMLGKAHEILRGLEVLPFQESGRLLWFDPGTLLVFNVSSELWQLKRFWCKSSGSEDLNLSSREAEALDEVCMLIKAGFLSFESADKRKKHNCEFVEGLETIYLYISDRCNLRCTYCARHFCGTEIQGSMSPDVIRAAIDMLLEGSGEKKTLNVVFTGGEPLLYYNSICLAVDYASNHPRGIEKEIRFGLTTNGTLVTDKVAAYIADSRKKFSVVLSLDGPQDIHDANRIYARGVGTYTQVVEAYMRFKAHGLERCFLRATIPRYFMHRTIEIVDHLASFAPYGVMVQPDLTDFWKVSPQKLPEVRYYLMALMRLANRYPEKKGYLEGWCPRILSKMVRALERLEYRDYGCGAALNMVAVAPNGDVFPCSWLIGIPQWRIGHVKESFDEEMQTCCYSDFVARRETCQSCFARHLCGGGCLAGTALTKGKVGKPLPIECLIFRTAARLALKMYVRERLAQKAHNHIYHLGL